MKILIRPEYAAILFLPFLIMLIYYFSKIDDKSNEEWVLYAATVFIAVYNVAQILYVIYRDKSNTESESRAE